MTDIGDRLRSPDSVLDGELPFEAAAEIDRLRADNEFLRAVLHAIGGNYLVAANPQEYARRALENKP